MPETVSPPPPPPYTPPAVAAEGLPANIAAALAYITIIPAIIFLVLEPYNRTPLVRFHSFQSIGLAIAAFVLQMALTISYMMLHIIPGGWMLQLLLRAALGMAIFIAWVICILKAYQGEFFRLPVIGDLADKQARG